MPYELDGTNDLYGVFNEERSAFIGDPYQQNKCAMLGILLV